MDTPIADGYWAAEADPKKLGAALRQRVRIYEEYIRNSGLLVLWRHAYNAYYGYEEASGYSSHELALDGPDGEYVRQQINEFRNLVTHYLQLATGGVLVPEPKAVNDDYLSEVETKRATGLLDYYDRERDVAQKRFEAGENAVIFGQGWVLERWNELLGEPIAPGNVEDPEAGTPVFEGDAEVLSLNPLDVARDPYRTDMDDPWAIVRTRINKWDLSASVENLDGVVLDVTDEPDADPVLARAEAVAKLQQAILAGKRSEEELMWWEAFLLYRDISRRYESDQIPLYLFFHNRTPAQPAGRMTAFLEDGTVVFDRPLGKYKKMPLVCVYPARMMATPFGYSPAWDLLAPQEAVNILSSIPITNMRAGGVAMLAVPEGANINPSSIQGLALIEYAPGMGDVKSLSDLFRTPAEVFQNRAETIGQMETIIGINSVVRGEPEASLKSGTALALVQSQAVQFVSGFNGVYVAFTCKAYTLLLHIINKFVPQARQMLIYGEDDALLEIEVGPGSFDRIQRVLVDAGNPLTKTLAGRVQIGETLLNNKMINDPSQYFSLLRTGRLGPMIKGAEKQRSLVRAENEMLARGEVPICLPTDDHRLHASPDGHQQIIASPQSRRDPAVLNAYNEHMAQHHDLFVMQSVEAPTMMEMLGQVPAQTLQQMQGADPAAEGGPGGEAPPEGGQQPAAPPGEDLGPFAEQLPEMPQMPVDPLTGVRPEAPGAGNPNPPSPM